MWWSERGWCWARPIVTCTGGVFFHTYTPQCMHCSLCCGGGGVGSGGIGGVVVVVVVVVMVV